jgi:2-deoxy-D-gluconate 3-dehydrogenase
MPSPGYISTDNTTALRADPQPAILARIRPGAEPEISKAPSYTASKASDYVNGSILVIDGGCR